MGGTRNPPNTLIGFLDYNVFVRAMTLLNLSGTLSAWYSPVCRIRAMTLPILGVALNAWYGQRHLSYY